MTRIEKTEINASAFIILSSTLKELQSDNKIKIVNEGRGVRIRKKEKHEKDFTIDLTFLDTLFGAMVTGTMGPLVVTGEAEKYLRNCSYACDYHLNEAERMGEFDHFGLFHNIHFSNVENIGQDEEIIRLFCGLFRVDFKICQPFLTSSAEDEKVIDLPAKKVFNEIFSTITLSTQRLIFKSGTLDMRDSLNSLFATKDLLFAKGIDASSIPEYHVFSIQQNEEANFNFETKSGLKIRLTFRYVLFKVEFVR